MYKTVLSYNNQIFKTNYWNSKKEANDYKRGILQGFTKKEIENNGIEITIF